MKIEYDIMSRRCNEYETMRGEGRCGHVSEHAAGAHKERDVQRVRSGGVSPSPTCLQDADEAPQRTALMQQNSSMYGSTSVKRYKSMALPGHHQSSAGVPGK